MRLSILIMVFPSFLQQLIRDLVKLYLVFYHVNSAGIAEVREMFLKIK